MGAEKKEKKDLNAKKYSGNYKTFGKLNYVYYV